MKSTKKQDWKIFEETVAQIEKVLSPKGAVIKTPDRIIDKITNQSREVDASIRYVHNSMPILITVECRDRKKVQDDMWIEQLVTKQRKIGATKTIAVSSKGFTKPARITAKEYGIELRTCEKVSDDRILEMLEGFNLSAISIYRQLEEFKLKVENKNKPSGVVQPDIEKKMAKEKHNVVVALTKDGNEKIRLNDLLDMMDESIESDADRARKIKGDTLVLNIKIDENYWYYPVGNTNYGIREIQLKLRFGRSIQNVPIVSVSNYYKEKTPLAQFVTANLKLDEQTIAEISLVRK